MAVSGYYRADVRYCGELSPGRFFAAAEVKLILAKLVLRYDMELIPGAKPMRMYIGTTKIPETKLKIRMRATTS